MIESLIRAALKQRLIVVVIAVALLVFGLLVLVVVSVPIVAQSWLESRRKRAFPGEPWMWERRWDRVGARSLDANVFGFRLGPYAEYPLNNKFSLLFSGGLYLVVGDSHFRFKETVTIVDPITGAQTTEQHRGSASQIDFLVGGYVGANIEYQLTKEFGLFAGAQFQTAGRAVNKARGKVSVLDMGESVVVSIGASYSF